MDLRLEFKRATGRSADKWIDDLQEQLDTKLEVIKRKLDRISCVFDLDDSVNDAIDIIYKMLSNVKLELTLDEVDYIKFLEDERQKANP